MNAAGTSTLLRAVAGLLRAVAVLVDGGQGTCVKTSFPDATPATAPTDTPALVLAPVPPVVDADGHICYSYSEVRDAQWDQDIDDEPWFQPDLKYPLWVKVFPCPRCLGRVQLVYHLELHAGFRLSLLGGALGRPVLRMAVPEAGVQLQYACTCARTHTTGLKGCGAQFLLMPPVAPKFEGYLVVKQGTA